MITQSTPAPREIKRDETRGITISWEDGAVTFLASELLRKACPCAGCKEKRGDSTHAKPLTGKKRSLMIVDSSLKQELELVRIWGVGQYALGMAWADGHDTGIYTFPYLREIAGQ